MESPYRRNNQGFALLRGPRSLRLQGYDYSKMSTYFVTVCIQNRACLFGKIVDGKMVLNEYGRVAAEEWIKTAEIRSEIVLDKWVIMPNHIHAIVVISYQRRGDRPVAPTCGRPIGPLPKSIGSLIAGYKSSVTKRINQLRITPGVKLWQRNYYDRIIRSDEELNRIREYIIFNPAQWDWDPENLLSKASKISLSSLSSFMVSIYQNILYKIVINPEK